MSYQEFKSEYEALVLRMISYTPEQAGSQIYAEKLADLSDKFPDYEARYDSEIV